MFDILGNKQQKRYLFVAQMTSTCRSTPIGRSSPPPVVVDSARGRLGVRRHAGRAQRKNLTRVLRPRLVAIPVISLSRKKEKHQTEQTVLFPCSCPLSAVRWFSSSSSGTTTLFALDPIQQKYSNKQSTESALCLHPKLPICEEISGAN
jgi:hypothetical protein